MIQQDYEGQPNNSFKIFGGYRDWATFLKMYQFRIESGMTDYFYEDKVSDNPGRLVFDVDWKLPNGGGTLTLAEEVRATMEINLLNYWRLTFPDIPEPQLCFAASVRENKIGIHIHAPFSFNWHFRNLHEHKIFRTGFVAYLRTQNVDVPNGNHESVIDPSAYNSTPLRLLFSAKKETKKVLGGKHQMEIVPRLEPIGPNSTSDVKDYLVTYINRKSKALPTLSKPTPEKVKGKRKERNDDGLPFVDLKDRSPDDTHVQAMVEAVMVSVDHLSSRRADNFNDWIRVGLLLHNLGNRWGVDFQEVFHKFSRRTSIPGYYKRNEVSWFWDHFRTDSEKKLGVTSLLTWAHQDSGAVVIFPRPESTMDCMGKGQKWHINREIGMPDEMVSIPSGNGDKVRECNQTYDLDMPVNHLVTPGQYRTNFFIRCDYGVGKTTRICSEIAKGVAGTANAFGIMPEDKILVVTFRTSLADKLTDDLASSGFECYNQIPVREDLNRQRMVVQLESLHRIPANWTADVVIIDESESLIKHFDSSTMTDRWMSLLILFLKMRRSRTVIMADKDLNARSYDLANEVHPGTNYQFINTFKKHQDEVMLVLPNFEDVVRCIVSDLQHNRKVAVCSNSKLALEVIKSYVARVLPNKRVKLTSSDSSVEDKQRCIRDVELVWTSVDLFLYTPSILAGVSQTTPYFNRMYVISSRFSCVPREVAQMMRRVRTIIKVPVEPDDILKEECEYVYFFHDMWRKDINRHFTMQMIQDMVNVRANGAKSLSIIAQYLAQLQGDEGNIGYSATLKKMVVYNTLETLDGYWNFDHRFRAMMAESGMKVVDVEALEPDSNLAKDLQAIRASIKNTRHMDIANAPILSPEELIDAKKKRDPTRDVKLALKKTDLCAHYNLVEWLQTTQTEDAQFRISASWVRKFMTPKLMDQYNIFVKMHQSSACTIADQIATLNFVEAAVWPTATCTPTEARLETECKLHRMSKLISESKVILEIIKLYGWNNFFSTDVIGIADANRRVEPHLPNIRQKLNALGHTDIPSETPKALTWIRKFCREGLGVPQRESKFCEDKTEAKTKRENLVLRNPNFAHRMPEPQLVQKDDGAYILPCYSS